MNIMDDYIILDVLYTHSIRNLTSRSIIIRYILLLNLGIMIISLE